MYILKFYDIIFIGDKMSRGCIYNIDFKTNSNDIISVSSDYFDHFYIANLNNDGDEVKYGVSDGSDNLIANFFMVKVSNDFSKEQADSYNKLVRRKDIIGICLSFTNGKRQEFEIPKKRVANNGVMENKYEEIFNFEDATGILITDKSLKYKEELFI